MKDLAFIDPKDEALCDYFYPDSYVSKDFFVNSNAFDEKMSEKEKQNFLITYLELKYILITPTTIKHVFKEIDMPVDLQEHEYPEMMITVFGKECLNLKSSKDRILFKNFLEGKEVETVQQEDIKKEEELRKYDDKIKDKLCPYNKIKKDIEDKIAFEMFPNVANKEKEKINNSQKQADNLMF